MNYVQIKPPFCVKVIHDPNHAGKNSSYATEAIGVFLAEDRRREKDPQMQHIKEMLAWGGICDAELRDPGEPWPVHDDVK